MAEKDDNMLQYLRAETERAQREVDILTKCLTCPQVKMMRKKKMSLIKMFMMTTTRSSLKPSFSSANLRIMIIQNSSDDKTNCDDNDDSNEIPDN